MSRREAWIHQSTHPQYEKIRKAFADAMQEQAHGARITYYDFLLVAKKMNFRFEQSAHLMALKNFFAKHKNTVNAKHLVDVLYVSADSLNTKDDKLIVKFGVPDTEFAPIKEEEEDEGEQEESAQHFIKINGSITQEQEKEINEKIAIILSIKMDEMEKKLTQLLFIKEPIEFLTIFEGQVNNIEYSIFRKGVLSTIGTSKLRLSEDDIKTIFFILDEEGKGSVKPEVISRLRDSEWVLDKMRLFYAARINRDMVKNTLFKLGKVKNNNIQIFQVKNGSLLQFESIERSILPQHEPKARRPPHFGPLKAVTRHSKNKQQAIFHSNQHINPNQDIKLERQKIQRILKMSKEQKHRDKSQDTIASKLRSLFIHKVILPREKMLEEQKEKYLKTKVVPHDLFVKSNK